MFVPLEITEMSYTLLKASRSPLWLNGVWYTGGYYDVLPFFALAYWIFYKKKCISLFLSWSRLKFSHHEPAQKKSTNKTIINQFWKRLTSTISFFCFLLCSGSLLIYCSSVEVPGWNRYIYSACGKALRQITFTLINVIVLIIISW